MSKTQSKPFNQLQGKRTDPHYQAQDILSRRDHSVHEVRTKLRKKGFSPEQISPVIEWLLQKKLLNDEQFARRYIDSTLRGKAVGRRWLSHKLKQKGVASLIIEATLATMVPPDHEQQLATHAADAWRRQHPNHRADKERLQRFLLSRGFSFDVLSSVT